MSTAFTVLWFIILKEMKPGQVRTADLDRVFTTLYSSFGLEYNVFFCFVKTHVQ